MTEKNTKRDHYVAISGFGLMAPLLWVIHFAVIYLAQQFLCLGSEAQGKTSVAGVILAVTVLCCALLLFLIFRTKSFACRFFLLSTGKNIDAVYSSGNLQILYFIVRLLAGLSLVAILWAASAVFFLHECGGSY